MKYKVCRQLLNGNGEKNVKCGLSFEGAKELSEKLNAQLTPKQINKGYKFYFKVQ